MSVRIVFLGALQDVAGHGEMEADSPLDWAGLLKVVGADTAAHLSGERVRVACGGRVLPDKFSLDARDGEEVALLPPVSGG